MFNFRFELTTQYLFTCTLISNFKLLIVAEDLDTAPFCISFQGFTFNNNRVEEWRRRLRWKSQESNTVSLLGFGCEGLSGCMFNEVNDQGHIVIILKVCMLQTRLAAIECMTHDVIRDLLGVKLDITNYANLIDQNQIVKLVEEAHQ
ncbi:kinesin-like protein KIN-12E [Vicia villosa]|uniref:kinesin-like protein KIN-12E n=1 Tax=Vicia villosa TaxID=3911 RepID=UPI00273C12F2|nr:kinesin-like protein KIN-12E [Vicia villosa]XP_058779011.1 kinesin-like protein KIN-12E [Vicia villosa]XP_058779012.1 kinesin-like protein KIN-12E [Vicia villosa]XP_058779013.1 kinesin-like protein KIN-12E [Vicia villosa]XP_058779014.1 kinesin-like protein KIN-12E [Vicia villosa]XP_058779015.1 kinesin-like protein KIN-12E [Vicia villosa]XP_058779016.1 kinesin-like protein KIN-12E [Vicia villosa]XP_058779017.1 kinesin-like protein KIN-12E [Vicia villosa]XP_058779018.1 kinesin-like protein